MSDDTMNETKNDTMNDTSTLDPTAELATALDDQPAEDTTR